MVQGSSRRTTGRSEDMDGEQNVSNQLPRSAEYQQVRHDGADQHAIFGTGRPQRKAAIQSRENITMIMTQGRVDRELAAPPRVPSSRHRKRVDRSRVKQEIEVPNAELPTMGDSVHLLEDDDIGSGEDIDVISEQPKLDNEEDSADSRYFMIRIPRAVALGKRKRSDQESEAEEGGDAQGGEQVQDISSDASQVSNDSNGGNGNIDNNGANADAAVASGGAEHTIEDVDEEDDDVLRYNAKRARTEAETESNADMEDADQLTMNGNIGEVGRTLRSSTRQRHTESDQENDEDFAIETSSLPARTRSGRAIKRTQRYNPGLYDRTAEPTTTIEYDEPYTPRASPSRSTPRSSSSKSATGPHRSGRVTRSRSRIESDEEEYVESAEGNNSDEDDDDDVAIYLEEEEMEEEEEEERPYNLRRRLRKRNAPSASTFTPSRPMTRSSSMRQRSKALQSPNTPTSYPLRNRERPNYSEEETVRIGVPRTENRYIDISRRYIECRMSLNLSIERYDPIDSDDSEDENELLELAKTDPETYANLTTFSHGDASESDTGKKKKSADASNEVNPVHVDKSVSWQSIGGLEHHVNALKEMVILPLLYPHIFENFGISPPRGVIFCGPPGTGKTLVARALANSCSVAGQEISFFMRKGSDVLSKYVGEAERQLRLLFEEARKRGPSIIFFDEVDGLTPARSSTKQDYIHTSIVSTLLALMDGLDSRGQVVVIGATNRIDAIDPALRRPGRFDRELMFTLPNKNSRKEIFKIHTKKWNPPVTEDLMEEIARKTVGYCGADIRALAAEAALRALRKKYPQIYSSTDIFQIDTNTIQVGKADFMDAMRDITPASHRNAIVHARPLPVHIAPLLMDQLDVLKQMVHDIMPITSNYLTDQHGDRLFADATSSQNNAVEEAVSHDFSVYSDFFNAPPAYRPWLLVHSGGKGQGHNHLARALLYSLEEMVLFAVGLNDLHGTIHYRSPVEALIAIFSEARKNAPSIIWLKDIDDFWEKAADLTKTTLVGLLTDIPSSTQIFFLTSSSTPLEKMDPELQNLFTEHRYQVRPPTENHIRNMFSCIFEDIKKRPRVNRSQGRGAIQASLPIGLPPASTSVAQLDEYHRKKKALEGILLPATRQEERKVLKEEGKWLRVLRFRLREILFSVLSNKHFQFFSKPTQSRLDYILHGRNQNKNHSTDSRNESSSSSSTRQQQQQQQRPASPQRTVGETNGVTGSAVSQELIQNTSAAPQPEQENSQTIVQTSTTSLTSPAAPPTSSVLSQPLPSSSSPIAPVATTTATTTTAAQTETQTAVSTDAMTTATTTSPPTTAPAVPTATRVENGPVQDLAIVIDENSGEETVNSTVIPSDLVYLYDVLDNLEQGKYTTLRSFLKEIKKICNNAIYYVDIGNEQDAQRVMAKANHLLDHVQQNANLLPNELVRVCNTIHKRMQLRERVKKEKNELDSIIANRLQPREQQIQHRQQQLVKPPAQSVILPAEAENGKSSDMHDEEEEEEQVLEIWLDEDRLQRWFDELIYEISTYDPNGLDSAFSQTYRYIYQHRHSRDRNALLEELERQLERMKSARHVTN